MGCFADDTAFWTSPAPKSKLRYSILQKELHRFHDWTKYWKLSLNPSKCKTLNIHKPKSLTIYRKYSLNNSIVNQVNEYNYLGLWIDEHLNFKSHINKTYTKLQGSLYRVYNLIKTGIDLVSKRYSKYINVNQDHKDANNSLQTLQNKFIRCAFPCKKSRDIQLLHMIADIQPLSIRIN